LHRYGETPGRITKRLTARKERRQGDREVRDAMTETPEELLAATREELKAPYLASVLGKRLLRLYDRKYVLDLESCDWDKILDAVGWYWDGDEPGRWRPDLVHVTDAELKVAFRLVHGDRVVQRDGPL
jgi:hypothetical protein